MNPWVYVFLAYGLFFGTLAALLYRTFARLFRLRREVEQLERKTKRASSSKTQDLEKELGDQT